MTHAAQHSHALSPATSGAHRHHHVADQAEILDLDAEVLSGHLAAIVEGLPVGRGPRRIVDLGCGTGAGAFALLDRFPEAELTAVDASPAHLERLRQKAAARGVATERLLVVQADLDGGDWPDLGRPDLVWASASMHHLADPAAALRRVHGLLAPGGLLALVELAGFPRFLPADAPAEAPGLEDRCHAAADARHAHHVSHRGADWAPLLTAAGFTVEAERTVAAVVPAAEHQGVARYALTSLQRLRAAVVDNLAPADLAALDLLLDSEGPASLLRREDLAVRTDRSVWAARRD